MGRFIGRQFRIKLECLHNVKRDDPVPLRMMGFGLANAIDWRYLLRREQPPEDQWDRLAELAKGEISVGDSVPLDDVFPTDPSQK